MRGIVGKLLHVHIDVVAALFVFFVIQFCAWIVMMAYVQFLDPKLGQSVLYVTQISHWALVESAGTAAISAWTLLQAKHTHDDAELERERSDA